RSNPAHTPGSLRGGRYVYRGHDGLRAFYKQLFSNGRKLSPQAQAQLAQARGQTLARVQPARAGVVVADAVQSAAVHAFQVGFGISASLVAFGGLLGLAGIRNPRRVVPCADCAGGQLAGQPLDAGLTRRSRLQPPPPATAAPTADTVT